jgi:hypothetical protein
MVVGRAIKSRPGSQPHLVACEGLADTGHPSSVEEEPNLVPLTAKRVGQGIASSRRSNMYLPI